MGEAVLVHEAVCTRQSGVMLIDEQQLDVRMKLVERLSKDNLLSLHSSLGLPELIRAPRCKTAMDSKIALFPFMKRITTGCRYCDLAIHFG